MVGITFLFIFYLGDFTKMILQEMQRRKDKLFFKKTSENHCNLILYLYYPIVQQVAFEFEKNLVVYPYFSVRCSFFVFLDIFLFGILETKRLMLIQLA